MVALAKAHDGGQAAVPARPGPATTGGAAFGKVPEVTFGFWLIKIAATTLGETAGDAITMTLDFGYLAGTAIFAALFAILVAIQVRARRFHAFLFWAVIIATTTVGTTLADFADRSLGIGYVGGSLLLAVCLAASLGLWRYALGSVAMGTVTEPRAEAFYWATILFSQTLGTALGDFLAENGRLGYGGGAMVFGATLLVTALLYYTTNLSRDLLFWAAFILTRPLGATVGDFLDKPHAQGGLALDRFSASTVLFAFIVAAIFIFPQRTEPLSGRR